MPDFKIDPDYVEVAQRIRDLFEKYPNASLGGTYEIVEVAGQGRVIYRATCHREPNDPNPGVGTAWEEVPGKTPYTKGSEIQNAETSAWGRAIVAVGASASKRIASADEMRSARARASAPPEPDRPTPAPKDRIDALVDRIGEADLADWVRDQGFGWPWTADMCDAIEAKLAGEASRVTPAGGLDHATPGDGPGPASPAPATLAEEALGSPLPPAEPPAATLAPEDGGAAEEPPAPETAEEIEARITAEVKAMPPNRLYEACKAEGLGENGPPKALRERLVGRRILAALAALEPTQREAELEEAF